MAETCRFDIIVKNISPSYNTSCVLTTLPPIYFGVVLHNLPLRDERAKKFQLQCFYGPNKSYEANKAGFLQRHNTP
jgi:hypothetical protein